MDRPILFSAPMVRALLDGRKTQTRRIIARNNVEVLGSRWGSKSPWDGLRFSEGEVRPHSQRDLYLPFCHPNDEPIPSSECGIYRLSPIIESGDRLWVREAFATPALMPVQYRADPPVRQGHWNGEIGPWKSPIHMPRWASRLTLTVTDVRVQRLQEISEEDAIAEGLTPAGIAGWVVPELGDDSADLSPVSVYRELWSSINGSGSWDANPWVAVYGFRVHLCNIDALPSGADHG